MKKDTTINYFAVPGTIKRVTNEEELGLQIVRLVCDVMKRSVPLVLSKSRKRDYVLPRQMASLLLRKHTKLTLKQMGHLLGGRDHSTVLHSSDTMQDLVEFDKGMADLFNKIDKRIVVRNF